MFMFHVLLDLDAVVYIDMIFETTLLKRYLLLVSPLCHGLIVMIANERLPISTMYIHFVPTRSHVR